MFDLEEIRRVFTTLHIVVAFAGLALFWVPAFAPKGGRLHVASGRLFVWCACFVAMTGLIASIWGLAHPPSFLSASDYRSLNAEQARLAAENLRFILSITGFFGLGVLSGIALGVRDISIGSRNKRLRGPVLLTLSGVFTLWSAALATYGATHLLAAHFGWTFITTTPTDAANHYWISVALGAFGVYGGHGDLRYILGPTPTPLERQSMHIECMIGAGAAFYAAFFLFGATRLLSLPGYWLLAPVIPIAISAIATPIVIRRHQSRFTQGTIEAPDQPQEAARL